MRRVLLATTALGMGAGVAFAQDAMMDTGPSITLSGDGRMGVVSDSNDDLKFDSRVRVTFTASATLDSGLTAGGSIRADNAPGGASGTAGNIYLAGPFGKLSMGDVDAGAKAAIGHVSGVGYRNLGDPNEIKYLRGGTEGEEPALQYALPKMGPVRMYASLGMAPVVEDGVVQADRKEISADTLSVGAKADLSIADMGSAWIGGGFEAVAEDDADGHLVLGAGASISGFTGKVVVGMQGRDTNDSDGNPIETDADGNAVDRDREQFAVSAGYSAGQMGVTVFYTDATEFGNAEATGAGFEWKLGGGASLKAGFTNWPAQEQGAEDRQTADLGVTFSF